jgi:hypothetical protein
MSDEGDPKDKKPDEPEGDADARARALVKKALGKARAAHAEEVAKTETEETSGTDDTSKGSKQEEAGEEPVSSSRIEGEPMSIVLDEVDLKDALRGALRPPEGAVAPQLLRGVQKKLRLRSRGKFYGDGWSTSESPKSTYLITTIIMLALVAILFFALIPWSSSQLP